MASHTTPYDRGRLNAYFAFGVFGCPVVFPGVLRLTQNSTPGMGGFGITDRDMLPIPYIFSENRADSDRILAFGCRIGSLAESDTTKAYVRGIEK